MINYRYCDSLANRGQSQAIQSRPVSRGLPRFARNDALLYINTKANCDCVERSNRKRQSDVHSSRLLRSSQWQNSFIFIPPKVITIVDFEFFAVLLFYIVTMFKLQYAKTGKQFEAQLYQEISFGRYCFRRWVKYTWCFRITSTIKKITYERSARN